MLRTDLIELINSGEMWAFVGSGASIDSGVPSWSKLVQGTIESLNENKKQEIDRDRRYKSAFSQGNYARCFSIIEEIIGRKNLEDLVSVQLESVQPPGKVTKGLADWPFAGYITTNYDELIERALQDTQEHGWLSIGNSSDEAQKISGDVKQIIWHVHGATSLSNDKSQLVLTEEDYDLFYLDRSSVIDKLHGLLTHRRVVFVGFGFGDPEVKRLLKRVGRLCNPARPAFAFLSGIYGAEHEQERLELLEKYNIDVIPYQEINDSHEQLHQLFDVYNSFILSRSLKFGQPVKQCPSYDPETTSLLIYNELALRNESQVTADVLKSLIKSRILSLLQYRNSITIEELCSDLEEKIKTIHGDSHRNSSDKSYESIFNVIGELYQENLISKELDSHVSLSEEGSNRIADQAATAKILADQFSASLQDKARIGFPDNPEAVARIAQTAETFLRECIHKRGLGVAMSWYSSRVDFKHFHIVALLQDLPKYISQLLTTEEGLVLIRLIEDILSRPNEVETKFLGISLQAQFGVHLLGCDSQTFQTRVRDLSKTLFLIDSSTLIPLLGRSSTGYHSARFLLNRLRAVGSSIATTQMLVEEAAEHARWAINYTRQDSSFLTPETLIRTIGRAGSQNNVFFEGFIEEVSQGTIPRDFGAYLDSVCDHPDGHIGKDEAFTYALQNINVDCLSLEEFTTESWNEELQKQIWNELEELQEQITERRKKNQTYRHERQVKAEAEAVIIIRNFRNKKFSLDEIVNSYFISNTRIIDDINHGTQITIRPEALTQWLSTVTPCEPNEFSSLFFGLFGELSERGLTIVDESKFRTVFAPLVDASKNQLEEAVEKHRVLIEQKYGRKADEAFSQVNDLDASTVVHSFYAQRTEDLELRLKKVTAQKQANLDDDERHELEVLRSERAFRKQRDLKRKRAAASRPKGKRKKKKKKKKS